MNEPIGSLCVLKDDSGAAWLVSLCQGGGRKLILRRFESQDTAADWAIEERARRMEKGDAPLTIHFPDDCPCCGNEMQW